MKRITPIGIDSPIMALFNRVRTNCRLLKNSGKFGRKLEIGPGFERIAGFEGIAATSGPAVDYLWDCSKRLPFRDNTFELIYASHIVEHIAWYKTTEALKDWVRVLKDDAWLEIWVPDAEKIVRAWLKAEDGEGSPFEHDNWTRNNLDKDPAIWAAGRIFTYGDGSGRINDFNWHRALFNERLLMKHMHEAGLVNLTRMDASQIRGYDHGWINLGVKGMKPAGLTRGS